MSDRTALRRGSMLAGVKGALTTLCLLLPALAAAQEQPVKPRVMLLFDTSGSMIWTTCRAGNCDNDTQCGNFYQEIGGDNSAECPGNQVACSNCNGFGCDNGVADDTRLWKVKKGASNVVQSFGEVTFGLSRFAQAPMAFSCSPIPNSKLWGVGGWYGADPSELLTNACSSYPIGTGFNKADILVGFEDNNQAEILSWMNNCDDYPNLGDCPQTLPPPTGCNLCPDCGTGCDKEIRAYGKTPIAGSLNDLRVNRFPALLAADSKSSCRPYKVILLTDGVENCVNTSTANDEAAALFTNAGKSIPVHVVGFGTPALKSQIDALAAAGGTGEAVVVDNEVALALAMANIVSESLLSEKCNGIDDDCDLACDEVWPEVAVTDPSCSNQRAAQTCSAGKGICLNTGVFVCKADGSGAECSVTAGAPNPGGEICGNGLDDDCDGAVDEGCPPVVCQVEICDGKDNDCDGDIDEDYVSVACGSDIGECKKGMSACVNGKVDCIGETPPTAELCDNLDNNCDTVIDNYAEACYPFSVGCDAAAGTCDGICQLGSKLCTAAVFGPCVGAVGPAAETCNGLDDDCDGTIDQGVGQECVDYNTCTTYVSCTACPISPDELCDGKDNDCNGQIDDNPLDVGKVCGINVGVCKKGITKCVAGKLECDGGVLPSEEVCDNLDNNCNHQIDENVAGEGLPCGSDVGECKKGSTKCVAGKIDCIGEVGATEEICDGKDNDCDGLADETAECPDGSACTEGQCLVPCKTGEFVCPGGTQCINGYCVPDDCAGVKCEASERCVDGKCVDRCAGVDCPENQRCESATGLCVDDSCFSKGCPTGKVCVNYLCVDDVCPKGTCPDYQICADGQCFHTCLNVTCVPGQSCVRGKCEPDLCANANCADNHYCKIVNGAPKCEPDPCRFVSCNPGQICRDATCQTDPCLTTKCPPGMQCEVSHSGVSNCIVSDPSALARTTEILATGAGGFACSLGPDAGETSAGTFWLGLLLLTFLWRRRR